MRVIRCEIENFGILRKKVIDLEAGCNAFYAENGWGKSTIAAFIKAMFYGLEGERKQSLADNERKRYQPWQGGVFGGRLQFEAGGKRYEVSRIFGEHPGKDFFELRDSDTNLISHDFSSRLGEELFQVDKESFEKTAFLAENSSKYAMATAGIHAKIGDVEENDLGEYESAQRKLKEALAPFLSKAGEKSIANQKNLISQSQEKLRKARQLEKEIADKELEKSRWEEKKKAVLQNKELFQSQQLQRRLHQEKAEYLDREWQKRNACFEEVRLLFPERVPEEAEMQSLLEKIQSLEELPALSADLPERENLSETKILQQPDSETLHQKKKELILERRNQKKKENIALILLLLGSGVVLLLWKWMIAGVFFTLLVMAGWYLWYLVVSANLRKWSRELKTFLDVSKQGEVSHSTTKILDSAPGISDVSTDLQQETKQAEIIEWISQLGFPVPNNYSFFWTELEAKRQRYEHALQQLQEMEEELDKLKRETAEYSYSSEIWQEDKELAVLEEIAGLQKEIQSLEERREALLQTELPLQQEVLKEMEQNSEILKKTISYLEMAKQNLTQKYQNSVWQGFQKYYQQLTGKTETEFLLDSNTVISILQEGKRREFAALSAGMQDLLGICLRLALLDAMYPGEKPCLVFDDPFVHLDSDKVTRGMELLKNISKEYQLFYFTCHQSRMME